MKSRFMGVILVGLLVSWLAACDMGQSVSDSEYVYRAREQLEKGDLRTAVIDLKNAIAKNPDNADARLMLGELYLEVSDGASAEKEFQRAQELGVPLEAIQVQMVRSWYLQRKYADVLAAKWSPTLPETNRAQLLAIQGDTFMRSGKIQEAEEKFNQARKESQTSAAPLVGLALVATVRHELDKAGKLLDEALRLDENNSAAWSLRGDLAHYQGHMEEAVDDYGKALGTRRDQMGNLEKRAVLLSRLGRFDEAQQDISRMRTLNARHPAVEYAMGILDLQQKNYSSARSHLEKILSIVDQYRDAVLQLGVAHLGEGNPEQAEEYLARAFANNPNYIPGRLLLAIARLQSGNYSSAEQLVAPVVAHDPSNSRARALLASALLKLGRTDEALEHLHKLVELNPDSPELQSQLGLGMLLKGNYDEGVQMLEGVLAQSPDQVQAEIMLVMAHLNKGNFAQAVTAAEEFAQRNPKAPMPLVMKGMGQLGLSDRAAARKSFEAALALEPGDPAANHRLAVLDMEEGHFDAARKHYEQILKVHPDHPATLHYLALLESRAGNEQAMVDTLTRAINAHPEQVDFHVELGRYYLSKGQPERALTLLLPEREQHSRDPTLLAAVGESYLALQNWSSARAEFTALVDVLPKRAQGYYLLALVCDRTDDFACVKQQLARALEVEPKYVEARLEWGHVLIREKRFDEAEQLLKDLKEDAKGLLRVHILEGALATARNQPERASRAYAEALAQSPSTTLVIELAKVKWNAGERDAAVATLEDWAREHPDDIYLLLARANYSLLLGHEQEAMDRYRRVIELVPGQVLALNNLSNLLVAKDPAQAEGYARRALEEVPDNPLVIDTLMHALLAQNKRQEARVMIDDLLTRTHRSPDARYLDALLLKAEGQPAAATQELVNILAENTEFALLEQTRQLLQDLNR